MTKAGKGSAERRAPASKQQLRGARGLDEGVGLDARLQSMSLPSSPLPAMGQRLAARSSADMRKKRARSPGESVAKTATWA
eukprot:7314279-Alexandrium_andersonii.AAC.1